jgi:hypothetical protein
MSHKAGFVNIIGNQMLVEIINECLLLEAIINCALKHKQRHRIHGMKRLRVSNDLIGLT